MKNHGLSQEGLKTIATVTMLIDHIGATLVLMLFMRNPVDDPMNIWYEVLYRGMRIIGRTAFPIYCFLLVEGAYHTKNPKKYALRLFIGMILSEIPFDLAFSGTWIHWSWNPVNLLLGLNWGFNSVMMTLLLGFGMLMVMQRVTDFWRYGAIVPFYVLAELLGTDYSGMGILLIALFALTRDMEKKKLLQVICCALLFWSGPKTWYVFGTWINTEIFALPALIPIFHYDGRKLSHNKVLQWGFYLFYPVHITLLAWLNYLIFNFTPLVPG